MTETNDRDPMLFAEDLAALLHQYHIDTRLSTDERTLARNIMDFLDTRQIKIQKLF